MREFHRGPYETAVGDGEMLTEVRVPLPPSAGQRLREGRAARRRLGVAAAGAAVWLDGGTIAERRASR